MLQEVCAGHFEKSIDAVKATLSLYDTRGKFKSDSEYTGILQVSVITHVVRCPRVTRLRHGI